MIKIFHTELYGIEKHWRYSLKKFKFIKLFGIWTGLRNKLVIEAFFYKQIEFKITDISDAFCIVKDIYILCFRISIYYKNRKIRNKK